MTEARGQGWLVGGGVPDTEVRGEGGGGGITKNGGAGRDFVIGGEGLNETEVRGKGLGGGAGGT